MFFGANAVLVLATILTVFEIGFLVFYSLTTTAFIRGYLGTRDRTTLSMGLITGVRIGATFWMVGLYAYAYTHPTAALARLLLAKLPLDLAMAGAITFFMWPQIGAFFGWQKDDQD